MAPIDGLAGDLQSLGGIIVKLAREICFKRGGSNEHLQAGLAQVPTK